MTGISVYLFGREVFALNLNRDKPTEAPDPTPPRMEAGSGHNFERDMNPPDPSGEEPWFDGRFGFHASRPARTEARGNKNA